MFCCIPRAVSGEKEVSSEVIFTTGRPMFHGSWSVLSPETERSQPLNHESSLQGRCCGGILVESYVV
jgi:hypothetical protein